MTATVALPSSADGQGLDPWEVLDLSAPNPGLTAREVLASRSRWGVNSLPTQHGSSWVNALVRQLIHPLALLLWGAAALSFFSETFVLAFAILLVLALNAAFAFAQERQAEHSLDAMTDVLPRMANVHRDGVLVSVPAQELVPGDVISIGEGDQVPADARILSGAADVDMSTLTGESAPVVREPESVPVKVGILQAPHVVLRGTALVAGDVVARVYASGQNTQIGEIADLTMSVKQQPSPLEVQITRLAWIVGVIAIGIGLVFLPVGLLAGLSWKAAIVFAIGLLIANVPEGLLPTVTLALAGGVRRLARRGAVVKRLSSVETLGSVSTICTDKTGTLTRNVMTVRSVWSPGVVTDVDSPAATRVMQWCQGVRREGEGFVGDPTEIAMVQRVQLAGVQLDLEDQAAQLAGIHRFDASLRRMSVIVPLADGPHLLCKGALETILPLCSGLLRDGIPAVMQADDRVVILAEARRMAAAGLRVLALADRDLTVPTSGTGTGDRSADERDLRLVGLVGLIDPPRAHAAAAIAQCHRAGIAVHVITGDSPATAEAIATEVGVRVDRVIDDVELDAMDDAALKGLFVEGGDIVFARASPQAKLRIAQAIRASGQIFAMTGDGVNDAPALRFADIGVAMGRGGTDVAREAASMVLTDDDFASIVTAIESGRQVYANIRKYIVYVFAHAVPEVVPFLLFALSGGSVPLGLTGMQILAIDLGTETLPALALGRERAEPGSMDRPPRPTSERIIRPSMLLRSWGLLGLSSAVLTTTAFLLHLRAGGWSPGDAVGAGSSLHTTYLEATSITFVGIVLCQIGTAFASRTDTASLFTIGIFSNRLLLWGIAFELFVAGAIVYLPWLNDAFGTSPLSWRDLLPLLPFPFIVWGLDEIARWVKRRRSGRA